MKTLRRLFFLSAIAVASLMFFSGCEKENHTKGPKIETLSASNEGLCIVSLTGHVSGLEDVTSDFECGIEYSTDASFPEDKTTRQKSDKKYSEFLDEDSKNVNFSDEYWEIVFKNPGEGYPDDINLDFDSEQWDIDRAKKYLKQWKDELPKIQEQKEREALVKEIGDKYPGNISYEGYDIYKVRVNNQSFKIDVAETPINEIKSIMAKLSKTQNN